MDNVDVATTGNADASAANADTTNLLGAAAAAGTANPNNLLNTESTAAATAATPAAADPFAWMPEKFRTKNEGSEDVSLDLSARKLAESYSYLEKRVGSGDIRPDTIDGYSVKIDGLDWAQLRQAPGVDDVLRHAHELGMNSKQVEFMVREVLASSTPQAETVAGMSQEDARAELQKSWADPSEYKRNMGQALSAINGLVGKDDRQAFMNRYGNDPVIVKMLAQIGGEMSEDRLTLLGAPVESAQSIDELMLSPAYRDSSDPKHAETVRRVRQHFQRQAGSDNLIV